MSTVAQVAAATPASRDRYVDFLRVASLLGVIVGHFVMAVVLFDFSTGDFHFTNILALAPWTRGATWVLQVMPVFFVVGGFSHAVTVRSLRRRGGGYADFVRARIGRLVQPALVFVMVWLVVGAVLDLAAGDEPLVQQAAQIAGQLLWFIGIYLLVAACAPLMVRAHERWGWRVLALLVLAVVAVDVVRLAGGVEPVMWLNFAFVWLAIHQAGFFYADGVADRVGAARLGGMLLGIGAVTLSALVLWGPYGVAMVSYEGETLSNLTPPTVALLAFATAQAGVLLLCRGPVTRWLQRPRPWRAVVAGGAVAMTAFLWHFTALIAVYAVLYVARVNLTAVPTQWSWWGVKALLAVPFALVVAALVMLWRRFDRPPAPTAVVGPAMWRTVVAALAAVCAMVGMLGFAVVGFRGVVRGYVGHIAVVPMTSLAAAMLVAGGAALAVLAARGGYRHSSIHASTSGLDSVPEASGRVSGSPEDAATQ